MFLAFLLLWIIFNGKFTLEILILGLLLCTALFAFCCKFMDYGLRKELRLIRLIPMALQYGLILIIEILKANKQVLHFIISPRYQVEPCIVHFTSDLQSETARVILANSITLTPGTITVRMEGNDFHVHCLDKEFAEGIDSSIFVELLEKMEAVK